MFNFVPASVSRLGFIALAVLLPLQAAQAEPSAAKNELIVKIVQLQRNAIEGVGAVLAQRPAEMLFQSAGVALQTRVPPEKREAIAKDIQADIKKYMDDTVPMLRERAVKVAPGALGAVLDEKFSEDELRQLIAIMESPVNRKYTQMSGELQKALGDKLVTDSRAVMDPKIKALEQTIGKRLGVTPGQGPGPSAEGKGPGPGPGPTKPVAK
jgi:uncharacterized protein